MKKFLAMLLFFLCIGKGWTQEIEHRVETIGGTLYYIHTIVKGNTMYGIQKLYKTSAEVLIQENPSVKEGIKIGQELIIPVSESELPAPKTSRVKENEVKTHKVKKKETLYGLTKKYNITQDELYAWNPSLRNDGLKVGSRIQVSRPFATQKINGEIDIKGDLEKEVVYVDSTVYHVVQKKETLYRLAKMYLIHQDSIIAVNPDAKEGLSLGDTLRIPLKKLRLEPIFENTTDLSLEFVKDSSILKEKYSVMLMAPFMLDMNSAIQQKQNPLQPKKLYKKTKSALQFYHGVLLAADSMRRQGMNIDLQVVDTQSDSLKVKKNIVNKETEIDLILGWFKGESIQAISAVVKENKIPTICPIVPSNSLLMNNPYIHRTIVSSSTKFQILARKMAKLDTSFYNLVLVKSNASKDTLQDELFLQSYDEVIKSDSIQSFIKVSKFNLEEIKKQLVENKENVIVFPSTHRGKVSALFTKLSGLLNKQGYRDSRITLMGIDNWEKYKNIDVMYKHKLNFHFMSSKLLSKNETKLNSFNTAFRAKFSVEPDDFAYVGFDVAMNYFSLLYKNGTAINNYIEEMPQNGIVNQFELKPLSVGSGYQNEKAFLLKYKDYEILPANNVE